MREIGKVIGVSGGNAMVSFTRSEACEGCNACRIADNKDMQVSIKNTLNARQGDVVEVELEARRLLSAGAWAYLFPLLMVFAGLGLGYLIAPYIGLSGDIAAVICSMAMLVVTFFALRAMNGRFAAQAGYSPKMHAIVTNEE